MPEIRAANDALDRVAEVMTPRLREAASEGGWPEDIAQQLKVGRDGGRLVPQFEGDHTVLENLEYGTQDAPPKPVMNNFFNNYGVQQQIKHETKKRMQDFSRFMQKLFS
jgi:hypothetical protein